MKTIGQDKAKKELKLDGIIKALFKISKHMVIGMLNSLFNENISYDAEIHYDDKEYIKHSKNFDKISADMVIIVEDKENISRYHIEYQTQYDDIMAIRMFEYGYYVAKQEAKTMHGKTVFRFPVQRVIYIEEDNAISDYEEMTIIFSDKQEVTIKVPVIKYWEYDIKALKEKKLEVLLPLQIFRFRKIFDSIVASRIVKEEKERLVSEKYILLKQLLTQTVAEINRYYTENKLAGYDIGVMQSALDDLWEYLINRYAVYKDFKKEDFDMVIREEYNPDYLMEKGMEQGIEKGMEKGIVLGEARARVEILMDYIKVRFGTLPEEYEEKINQIDDNKLREIMKNVFAVDSLDEIIKSLK